MRRAVDLNRGPILAITDLHGDWDAYARYRNRFLKIWGAHSAARFVVLGDAIHGYGAAEDDRSVEILLDIIRLQDQMGPHTVIFLLGNHEFSHLYHVPLQKGNLAFMPRFERALGRHAKRVTRFLLDAPFMVRTAGGVLLVHAGASAAPARPGAEWRMLDFSHEELLAEARRRLQRRDITQAIAQYERATGMIYGTAVADNMGLYDRSDPRYYDLLCGYVAHGIQPEWGLLWDFFFTQCEWAYGGEAYAEIVEDFLWAYSVGMAPQRVMASGHIAVEGCHKIVTPKHLRFESWAHAAPHEAGCYLLFDADQRYDTADELASCLRPMD